MPILRALLGLLIGTFRSRMSLQLEIVALRHQLALYQRSSRRPWIHPSDRIFWTWLARYWDRRQAPGSGAGFGRTGPGSVGNP